MPLGLGNQVIRPAVADSPGWLHPLMFYAIHLWNSHPISLATGSAWIEVGIGLGLIVSNANVGRVIAAVSVVWAMMIWLVPNGAGGVFASGSSLLFGWPGATLFYAIAGVWIALSPDFFKKYFSLVTLRILSVLLAIAAVLQCLPSGEFWHGGNTNAFTAMTREMTATAQPHGLSWIVRHVGDLAGNLGGGFNIVVILWIVLCAAGFWIASVRNINWPFVTFAVGAVIFWITGEDISIYGGLATDINSLIPLAVLAWCACPKLRNSPALARRLPEEFRSNSGAVVAAFATAMVLFSVVSMGVASVSAAETTLFVAQNGAAISVNTNAHIFTLTDQFNKPFTLGQNNGHYTLLTFLDPVCWTDCPLLAEQTKEVKQALGASAPLDIVAVASNPLHQSLADVRHFIHIHDLADVQNFYFVTGKTALTRPVWKAYGIGVTNEPGEVMSIHSDFMFIIAPDGKIKWIIPDDPLSGIAGQRSTESELLLLLHKSGLS
jgi:cytochrome oxidase Cu insertion factor (SCO1/SenC/PrrC family)